MSESADGVIQKSSFSIQANTKEVQAERTVCLCLIFALVPLPQCLFKMHTYRDIVYDKIFVFIIIIKD